MDWKLDHQIKSHLKIFVVKDWEKEIKSLIKSHLINFLWLKDVCSLSFWCKFFRDFLLLTLSCLVVMIVVIDNDKVVNEIASVWYLNTDITADSPTPHEATKHFLPVRTDKPTKHFTVYTTLITGIFKQRACLHTWLC